MRRRLSDLIWNGVFALFGLLQPKPLDQMGQHLRRIREQEQARERWIREHRGGQTR